MNLKKYINISPLIKLLSGLVLLAFLTNCTMTPHQLACQENPDKALYDTIRNLKIKQVIQKRSIGGVPYYRVKREIIDFVRKKSDCEDVNPGKIEIVIPRIRAFERHITEDLPNQKYVSFLNNLSPLKDGGKYRISGLAILHDDLKKGVILELDPNAALVVTGTVQDGAEIIAAKNTLIIVSEAKNNESFQVLNSAGNQYEFIIDGRINRSTKADVNKDIKSVLRWFTGEESKTPAPELSP